MKLIIARRQLANKRGFYDSTTSTCNVKHCRSRKHSTLRRPTSSFPSAYPTHAAYKKKQKPRHEKKKAVTFPAPHQGERKIQRPIICLKS